MNYLYQHANFEQIDLVISIFGQFLDRNKPVQEMFTFLSSNVQDGRISPLNWTSSAKEFNNTERKTSNNKYIKLYSIFIKNKKPENTFLNS